MIHYTNTKSRLGIWLTSLVPGGIEESVVLHAWHSQCVWVKCYKASVFCTEAWDPKPGKEEHSILVELTWWKVCINVTHIYIISQQKDTPFDFSLSSKLLICFHGMFKHDPWESDGLIAEHNDTWLSHSQLPLVTNGSAMSCSALHSAETDQHTSSVPCQ